MSSEAVGRAALDAWQDALAASGLPVAGLEPGGSGRARIAFAAPLPALARGAAELADLFLLDPCRTWAVREALEARLPAAHHWRGAESVWLGAPPLAGRVVGADWTVVTTSDDTTRDRLRRAADALVAARTLLRSRPKGGAIRSYDLRPLLARLSVADPSAGDPSGFISIRFRTRIHPELGSGRPEEVIAALGEAAGLEVAVQSMTRDRVVLVDDGDGDGARVGQRAAPRT